MFGEIKESAWSIEHLARHGVSLDEVREAVLERPVYQHSGRNNTVNVYGRTFAGRYLFVVLADQGNGLAFVVTARTMQAKERRLFHRKAR
ncbi:hypothetical protein DFQ14_111117 [Halopolyspora algeriensis]|uniref:Uncharacterized protein n=1 Tax=Halopolyspora algeriensis TaxID=1500506 RepID=A0A368VGM1_9ACTN|nr:BrnT family toxin [Halopolyspora algeriensis]RCW40468.1 hypothetical protein DFQ14_111117 [Halopolyspora algeriensis]TQM53751.1 hypothetical protein FHU43_1915 [Halopolyspora algeriensis]